MMTLSLKERLRRAIRHEPVDRLPTQINYTAAMGQALAPDHWLLITDH